MDESESQEMLLKFENGGFNCGRSLACDPKRRLHRYLILIPMCFLCFGSYFCYDTPAALEDIMMDDLKLDAKSYMNFYAWYSWPNVILSFIGGFLIDRVLGIRLGAIIFASFVLVGQLIFASGAYIDNYILCIFGRFTFGIGGESVAVTQNTYASAWFERSELNFIFGLQLSMTRLGSTLTMISMEPIYKSIASYAGYKRLGIALYIASATALLSLFCAIILAGFDLRAERILKKKKEVTDAEKITLSDLRHFSWALWLICGICVTYYVAVFPFVSLSKVFLIQKYGLHGSQAASYISWIYTISIICSPIAGFLIDLTGRNILWTLVGTLGTLGCHALFSFTFIEPIIIIVILGICLSLLASALWPLVAFVVPLHQRATAFGIIQSIQNLGLGLVAIIAGIIQDSYGFLKLEVFFSMCLCLTLLLIVILYLWDLQNDSILNESGPSRRKKAAVNEMAVSQTMEY